MENKSGTVTDTDTVQVSDVMVHLTNDQVKNADIVMGKIEHKNISHAVKLSGIVDVPPESVVSVSFPMGGFLKSSHLSPGMHVTSGSVMAVIQDPQFIQLQQDYLTAKSNLTFLELEFNRQQELNKTKATSDKVYQQAQANFNAERVLLKSLGAKLKLIGINPNTLDENHITSTVNIYAPLTGYITKVNVNNGKYVNPSDILFEIINPDDIQLVLNVFEKDISGLMQGLGVMAYTNSDPDKKYNAEITLIGRELSEDRTVKIYSRFKGRDKALVPGMYMNAEINVKSNAALVVPVEAIVSFTNKQYVFVRRADNQFEMIEIMTGNSENNFVEILSDNAQALSAEEIVIKGAYSLLMKMKNTSDE